MYNVDDCPHFMCRHCAKWKVNADMGECTCPKLDHKKIKLYKPYFKTYDCGAHHIICSEFVPSNPDYKDFEDWTNFEDYWKIFKEVWLTDNYKSHGVAVVLNGNYEIIYYVPLNVWLYGDLVVNGRLQATIKAYHKPKYVGGVKQYPMVYEPIDGVDLQ